MDMDCSENPPSKPCLDIRSGIPVTLSVFKESQTYEKGQETNSIKNDPTWYAFVGGKIVSLEFTVLPDIKSWHH